MDRKFVYENILGPGAVCPCPGAIYMYMTKIFSKYSNILICETAWPIVGKLYVEHP